MVHVVKLLLSILKSWRAAAVALLIATLALGIYGIGRSLWLDEAWVANSVMEPSIRGMFYYPAWLQSTPPLFLLLVRAAVGLFGVSNAAFRAAPLAFAVGGVAAMIAVSRRVLSLPFAMLASALLAFHPTAIEYARTCKQYSAEMAAAPVILLALVLYLKSPTGRSFGRIVAVFLIALPLAWAVVFIFPGVAIAVWAKGGWKRAAMLTAIFGGWLGILYAGFIRGNVAPQLRAFWIATAKSLSPGLIAVLIFCVGAAIWAVWRRNWLQIAALTACLLFAAADLLRLYPGEPRSRLFLLPCFLLVAAMVAEALWNRVSGDRRWASLLIGVLVVGLGVDAGRKQIRDHKDRPEEDYQGAVAMLRQRVGPSDLLLVHASVIEGFRLYWRDSHAIFGSTGFPCCARNRNAMPRSSKAQAVYDDIGRMAPAGFTGRVWLFYSDRATHWRYVGEDESVLWIDYFRQRGCRISEPIRLENLAISVADCGTPPHA